MKLRLTAVRAPEGFVSAQHVQLSVVAKHRRLYAALHQREGL